MQAPNTKNGAAPYFYFNARSRPALNNGANIRAVGFCIGTLPVPLLRPFLIEYCHVPAMAGLGTDDRRSAAPLAPREYLRFTYFLLWDWSAQNSPDKTVVLQDDLRIK
jgi:hypothetical protein